MINCIKGWLKRRQAKNQLHNLSNKELNDLGINRGDIDQIIDLEYYKNEARKNAQ